MCVCARVARSKKAFTIAEELILPSAVDMCQELLGDTAATKIIVISAEFINVRQTQNTSVFSFRQN